MKLAYLRKPKTTQERRMNVAHAPFVRRCRFRIPTHCDDISVSTLGDRCWKNYRRKQYKTVSVI